MPVPIERSHVLLAEGKDEEKFFDAYLKHIQIPDVQVIQIGGKDRFKDEFPAFLNDPGFNSLVSYAIVRDADGNDEDTHRSIVGHLRRYKQPIPQGHAKFASDEKRKVGIFIMPGNAAEGMLEDLCLETVKHHPIMACVDAYIGCLENRTERIIPGGTKTDGVAYFPKNLPKARTHAFLSGMHEYVPSLGIAAEKGYWDLDSDRLAGMKRFLEDLVK